MGYFLALLTLPLHASGAFWSNSAIYCSKMSSAVTVVLRELGTSRGVIRWKIQSDIYFKSCLIKLTKSQRSRPIQTDISQLSHSCHFSPSFCRSASPQRTTRLRRRERSASNTSKWLISVSSGPERMREGSLFCFHKKKNKQKNPRTQG